MPLRGEDSLKSGVRFETKWTVYYLAKVLAEEYDSIYLASPGVEGQGCEFFLKKGDLTEYHQVKRQQGSGRSWSIADLARIGVLKTAFEKTAEPNSSFVFFSTLSAGTLSELTEAAKKSASLGKFRAEFLKGARKQAWGDLLDEWRPVILQRLPKNIVVKEEKNIACERETYDRLKRIYAKNEDEDSLTEKVDLILRTLVRAESETVLNDLAAFVSENVTKTLYADNIWSYLESHGYRRVDYSKDTSVLASMQECNKRYESFITHIRDDICIPREEAEKTLAILLGDGKKQSVLVSGEAGVGKSVVLGQAIKKLKDESIPHLYFRLDRLDSAELPKNVGEQLDLPASPVEVLGGFAKARPCVLIIDQLDAVSIVSGRNSEFFLCIHEIIRQTETFPSMRLLMACRRFDLEKDNRLRELIAKNGVAIDISIKPFSVENVKSILQDLGFFPTDFTKSKIELLQLPFHLSLFAQVAEKNRDKAVAFTTAIDLFDAYWEQKRRAVDKMISPQQEQWNEVIDRLCEEMNKQQTLSIEESIVIDDFEKTVQAMLTEHVLISDGRRIGFFHESFFDYVFARRFRAKQLDLIKYLKLGGQHLFNRSPMRQILMYEHSKDHKRFVQELRRLLTDGDIRFHLKKAAMEAVERVDHASPELWDLFFEILNDGNTALTREVWTVFIKSKAWFPPLYKKSLLRDWMASPDLEIRRRTLRIIAININSFPKESVELLEPYVGKSPEWNKEILHIIWRDALYKSRDVFNLFLKMVENNAVAEGDRYGFWSCIYDLPKRKPAWTAEAVGIYLRHVLDRNDPGEIKRRFLGRDRSGVQLLPEIAQLAPVKFLDNVLPFFLKIVTGNSREKEGGLKFDSVWSIRMYWPDSYNLENALLIGLETALKVLAEKSPEDFSRYMEKLYEYGNYDSVNFLLVRAFSVADPQFADQIVDYVIENPQRLECGWSGGASGVAYWAGYKLIEHVSKYCLDESLLRLEKTILNHCPRPELTKEGLKRRGYWQLNLLSAIDPRKRSIQANNRVNEWKMKFPKLKIKAPQAITGGVVHSPIPEDSAERMSDDQWLGAIKKYNSENRDWPASDDFLKGGAAELSRVLELETKKNPGRFAHLALRFPPDTHQYYFDSILGGLQASDTDKNNVFEVVRKFFSLPEKPGARWMADIIKKYSEEIIPGDILTIIAWLATEADDPTNDELTVRSANESQDNLPRDLFSTAINSVRGTAAEAVGTLIFDNADRVRFFKPYLERMIKDPTVVVRTTVAASLRGLYKHSEKLAVDYFLHLCETDQDALFATPHIDRFLYYANRRHFDRLRPILRRMLDSELAPVREEGSKHACLAQFNNPDASDMVIECLKGDEIKRRGVVLVAAKNLFHEDCREFSQSALGEFFNDPLEEIRRIAADCFNDAKGRQLESCRELIKVFIHSKAFAENMEYLIRALKRSTADIAEETLDACEAAIDVLENKGAGPGSHLYFEGGDIAELVLRTYRNVDKECFRSRCLDLIDKLLSVESYGISKELEAFER